MPGPEELERMMREGRRMREEDEERIQIMNQLRDATAAIDIYTDELPLTQGDLRKMYKKIENLISEKLTPEPIELMEVKDIPSKKRNYVYLAGNISSDPATYNWRQEFSTKVADEPRIVVVNPCLNEFDKHASETKISQMQLLKRTAKQTQKALRAKDYKMVGICNIFVVNLSLYNRERPMIGTLQELVWAHDIHYMPIIAITGENSEDNPYVQHMWIDECCSAKVETVQEAVDMIKDLFVEY